MGVSATIGRSLGGTRRGLGTGAFAVLDQALFAGSSFSINILLARWLPPVQYGAFALAFFLFLLLGALHTAVLTEPMLVLPTIMKKLRPLLELMVRISRSLFAVRRITSSVLMLPTSTSPDRIAAMTEGVAWTSVMSTSRPSF